MQCIAKGHLQWLVVHEAIHIPVCSQDCFYFVCYFVSVLRVIDLQEICQAYDEMTYHNFLGYDGLPIESMQGLDINSSHPGSTYGHIGDHGGGGGLDTNTNTPLPHQQLPNQAGDGTAADYHDQDGSVPQPPNDNNQVKAISRRE